MGLHFIVSEAQRLQQLNAIVIPPGVDDLRVRSRLLNEYNLEIGAGLGAMIGRIWRIGLMGYGSNQKNVMFGLEALNSILKDLEVSITPDVCIDAAAAYTKIRKQ